MCVPKSSMSFRQSCGLKSGRPALNQTEPTPRVGVFGIHSDRRRRYPDVMASSAGIIATDKPPRCRRWIPLSLRMFVAILVLLAVGSALRICVPAYRQLVVNRLIQRHRGGIRTEPVGPAWLRARVGDETMGMFDEVVEVHLAATQITDDTLLQI